MKRSETAFKHFLLFTFILLLPASYAVGQEAEEEIIPGQWYTDVVARVAAAQVGFQNWQGGGVNSLSGSLGLDAKTQKTTEGLRQTHEAKLGLGGVSQNDLELRKSEDILSLGTTFEYIGKGFFNSWHPTFSASLLTQFLDGYDYSVDPKVRVSGAFAPGYVTESLGLTRQITPGLSQRFGFASKQTIVSVDSLRRRYGNDVDELVRIEAGLESHTEFKQKIAENVSYKSSLGVFMGFSDAGHPDVNWSNLITMKVNSWLNTNFELVAVYDDDVLDKIQLREGLSVGALFNLK